MLPWLVSADTASFDAEATASVPVVVDLWAPWCGPCRMGSPALEELARAFAGRVTLVEVDVDTAPETARRFHVQAVPPSERLSRSVRLAAPAVCR